MIGLGEDTILPATPDSRYGGRYSSIRYSIRYSMSDTSDTNLVVGQESS
jgi:hypothetical protein